MKLLFYINKALFVIDKVLLSDCSWSVGDNLTIVISECVRVITHTASGQCLPFKHVPENKVQTTHITHTFMYPRTCAHTDARTYTHTHVHMYTRAGMHTREAPMRTNTYSLTVTHLL